MNRSRGWLEHAGEGITIADMNDHTLRDEHSWIEPADLLDAQEAILVDVANQKADLVEVGGDRDARAATTVSDSDQVAEIVDAHGVDQWLQLFGDDAPDPVFTRGDARRLGQFAEQCDVDRHVRPF